MDAFALSQLFDIDITAEHLKILENKVQFNKSVLKQQYEVRQKDYAEKKRFYEKRIMDLAKIRETENLTRIAKNQKRIDNFCFGSCSVKTKELYRIRQLVADISGRNQKKTIMLEKIKKNRPCIKYENALKRRTKILKKRHDEELIREVRQKNRKNIIQKIDIVEEEIPMDTCAYIKKIENKPPEPDVEVSVNTMFKNRLENLKHNFKTCEQGLAFFHRTKPLWDEMTGCLNRNRSVIFVKPKSSISKKYEDMVMANCDLLHNKDNSLLVKIIMGNDTNYYMNDTTLEVLIKKVNKQFKKDTDALEILDMLRRVVEHMADAMAIATFVAGGFAKKCVFEYAKREIAKKIFVDMRKVVDRLQHINTIVTNEVIASKDRARVESVIYHLLSSDDFNEFDKPVDDELPYIALMTENAVDRMLPLLQTDRIRKHLADKPVDVVPFNGRDELLQSFDKLIAMFLEMAHKETASFVTTYNIRKTYYPEEFALPPMTMMNVYRISRKLTKLAFGMFRTSKNTINHYTATVQAYKLLVGNRSPNIKYNRRPVKCPDPVVDVAYFVSLAVKYD